MTRASADVVVCGAGIAGIACAWQLAVRDGVPNVALVEADAPLSLTSDKSTECYRNWWPGSPPAMTQYMNRSIDLLEALAGATGNRFLLDRRGYLFASAEASRADAFTSEANAACERGAGALRIFEPGVGTGYQPADAMGFDAQPTGADLLLDRALIRRHFPYLSDDTRAVLHARRCGGLSAQQLGMLLLEQARESGVQLMRGEVVAVDISNGAVSGVEVFDGSSNKRVDTTAFINAAGPHLAAVAQMHDEVLPVVCEKHVKLTFDDRLGVVPRDAPLLLWTDPVTLPWSDAEREALTDDDTARYLLEPFPAGVHGRPLGRGRTLALYWTWDCEVETPRFPVEGDPTVAEINLRGMSRMLPGLAAYFEHLPNPYIDGGYYTKTADNRPLIGALRTPGAFVCGGFSGFGIMASLAGAEVLSAAVRGIDGPSYDGIFAPERFADSTYAAAVAEGAALAGQL